MNDSVKRRSKAAPVLDVERLARDFAQAALVELGGSVLSVVNLRNARAEYAGCCATHDFCDANMLMLSAMEAQGAELDASDDEQARVVNSAWELAKRAGFDPARVASASTSSQGPCAASEIRALLGGAEFEAAVGARELEEAGSGLRFRLARKARSGINLVLIEARGQGHYDATYFCLSQGGATVKSRSMGLVGGQLAKNFTRATGLGAEMSSAQGLS
jgi:hypothetical protein